MPDSKQVDQAQFLEKRLAPNLQFSEKDRDYQNSVQLLEVLDLMPVMWLVAEVESGKVLYFNRELGETLLYSFEELEQMNLYDLSGRDQEDQVGRLIVQLKKENKVLGLDNVLLRKDYSPVEAIINAKLIKGNTKGEDWMLIVFHNLTDYKRAAKLNIILENRVQKRTQELRLQLEALKEEYKSYDRIDKLARELQRSNNDLEQFAYITSHDLQEPLRMVTSYLQLLERRAGEKLSETETEFLNYAVDGALRMKELLDGILEYSRINTRGNPFAATSLNEILDQVQQNLRKMILDSQAVVLYDDLPEIRVDQSQMIQLFQNLIGNAIKFSGESNPVIEISYSEESLHHRIEVKDNGIGIAEKYLSRIFLIFQRLNRREVYTGNGIGLSICKGIVQRHGGKIKAESVEGEGTKFIFTLRKW